MLCCVVLCFWGAVWCVVCGMCPSKTSPCVPAPRAHVETHVRVVPVHTEMCRMDTREGRGGCEGGDKGNRHQPRVFHR